MALISRPEESAKRIAPGYVELNSIRYADSTSPPAREDGVRGAEPAASQPKGTKMDEESKKHADAMLDFWTSGKAMWSPKFDPRHQKKTADADSKQTDAKKEEDVKAKA